MIKFFCFDAAPLNDDALFLKYYGQASGERKRKIDSLRFRADKNLSLGAGILLDYGLREYGLRERDMKYGASDNGKPCFLNEPSIRFSISHSAEKVTAAFSDSEIGCDIEKIREIDLNIARRFFREAEYDYIMKKGDPAEKTEAFFRLWTFKESFMKLTGLGMRLPFDAFEICPGEVVSVIQNVFDGEYHFKEFDTIPGYKCALCSENECSDVSIEFVDISASL